MGLEEKWREFEQKRSFREFYFFAVALILAFGSLQTAGTVMGTEKPVVSVVSCSMYPQYHVGDILLVQGKEFGEIQEGDTIVYAVGEVEISVGESVHSLNVYSEKGRVAETAAGKVRLLRVVNTRTPDGNAKVAVLEVDGRKVVLRKGESINTGREKLKLVSATGNDIPVVHRVVEKETGHLETKGDNNPSQLEFEKNVTEEQVHGKVLFSVPRIGGLKLLAMDLAGLNGGSPIVIDSYPSCQLKVPLDQRQ